MKRTWSGAVLVLALPALALGQSLGEAAKKERERRDKLRQGGAGARTLTEDDLATTKGALANDPKAKAPESAAPEKGGRASGTSGEGAGDSSKSGEEYWRGRARAARGRVADAQRRCDAFQRMIRLGQPASFDENGRRVIYSVQQLKTMADAADSELLAAQAALEATLEEGRRAGAQPGWLR
jgi:hypothetical protein